MAVIYVCIRHDFRLQYISFFIMYVYIYIYFKSNLYRSLSLSGIENLIALVLYNKFFCSYYLPRVFFPSLIFYSIADYNVDRVVDFKDLGILFDSKLNRSKHRND